MEQRIIERAPTWRDRILGLVGGMRESKLLQATRKLKNDGLKTVGHWGVPALPQHPEWQVCYAVADLLQGDSVIEPRWYGFVGQIGMWWAWDNTLSKKGQGYGARSQEEAIRRLIAACNKE